MGIVGKWLSFQNLNRESHGGKKRLGGLKEGPSGINAQHLRERDRKRPLGERTIKLASQNRVREPQCR